MFRGAVLAALLGVTATGALAQSFGTGLSLGAPALPSTPIVTLDQDRLFNESLWGRRVAQEIEDAFEALATENRQLEAELAQEEQRLTAARPELDPAAFRAEADAFDARVVRIRNEQDGKARVLQRRGDRERQVFLQDVVPILAEIVAERGAVAILDERAVFLAADSVDITDEALRRIDAVLGSGSGRATEGSLPDLTPELRMPEPDSQGE